MKRVFWIFMAAVLGLASGCEYYHLDKESRPSLDGQQAEETNATPKDEKKSTEIAPKDAVEDSAKPEAPPRFPKIPAGAGSFGVNPTNTIREANSDLHNPSDIDFLGNLGRRNVGGNDAAPVGVRPEADDNAGRREEDANDRRLEAERREAERRREEALRAQAAREEARREEAQRREDEEEARIRALAVRCTQRAALGNIWDERSQRCVCQPGHYVYSVSEQIPECHQAVRQLALDFNVSAHSGNGVGTDSTMRVEICPQDRYRDHEHWRLNGDCLYGEFRTGGEPFERGTSNRVMIDFGRDVVVPVDGIAQIRITHGGGGDGPAYFLRDLRASVKPTTGPDQLLQTSLFPLPEVMADFSEPRGFETIDENTCVDRWIGEGETVTLNPGQAHRCGTEEPDDGDDEIHFW